MTDNAEDGKSGAQDILRMWAAMGEAADLRLRLEPSTLWAVHTVSDV